MQKVTILGATGSIGMSTLDVLEEHRDQYEIFALTGQKQIERLVAQCVKYHPQYAVVPDEIAYKKFHQVLHGQALETIVLIGEAGLTFVSTDPEVSIVMAAIVGSAGLSSTLAALHAGKKVLLANKEALVMAGDLVLAALKQGGGQLIPVDSEHSAIFQCLPPDFLAGRLFPKPAISRDINTLGVQKIVLTASGGATRDLPLKQLAQVSPELACTHPNWSMGKKITIDSATMMNKALELIEAYYLFGLSWQYIEVIVHPQSIVHSMVYYDDASVLAQLGQPDMRTPIACALAWPERIATKVPELDLTQIPPLCFAPLDHQRYPCVDLAYQALKMGRGATTILNAANEVAVDRFLQGHIRFTDIYALNAQMLESVASDIGEDLASIKACDAETRCKAWSWVRG